MKTKHKNRMLSKICIWVMLFSLIVSGQTILSFATNYSINEPIRLTTIENENLPNSDKKCTNLSGMAYSDSYNRLYTAKVYDKDGESNGYFYYYPNISNMSNYKMFLIEFIGHANGMTVDNSYVYITASSQADDPDAPQDTYHNHIIRISRSYIHNLANGSTITSSNYTRFVPKYRKSNGTLADYDKQIGNISRYNADETFIINIPWGAVGEDFAFTTAQIEIENGSPVFVVNRSDSDIFVVKNYLKNRHVSKPDIEYSPDCGLFIPRWYGHTWLENGVVKYDDYYNPLKTVILWANIMTGNYALEDIGTRHNIRVYTPDKINCDVSPFSNQTPPKYTSFEVEAVAIYHYTEDDTEKADLLFSANVQGNNQKDGIFRLKRADGGHFKIL